ncbi:MAG: efflux RND transporter periplasmic adaptor subunit [Nevskiaceae bacterium]|nr:MAG: efflux RND transporter periplasmic adaptor subunit [Nevskiaceae bacterium]TBR72099.1 MAG: efflux RND transporter periplasmic adaptor subunit [Nevskiaceae bacterium]
MTSTSRFTRRTAWFGLCIGSSLLLAACGSKDGPKPAPPPPTVGVVTLAPETVTLTSELPARTVAYRIAEVRPQVSGVILKRSFKEGGMVEKGQPLYQIDPAPYQAAYDSAKAALENAQAALAIATLKVERYQPLVATNAVSKLDFATMQATEKQARAGVSSARAALETARINLRYTKVLSPIKGRSSRSLVTEGALVTANQATPLTTVQQLDPIYVDATQPSTTLLRLQREYADGALEHSGDNAAKVGLRLGDGSIYGATGQLQFSEVTVDPNTNSITLRSVFPNPKHQLLPGMFTHVSITEGTRRDTLLVPQQGITHDPAGNATAFVVDPDDTVKLVSVTAARAIGDKWLVTQGLKAGDRVVVSGLQFVHPGAKVKVEEVKLDATVAPGTAPAQPAQDGDGKES